MQFAIFVSLAILAVGVVSSQGLEGTMEHNSLLRRTPTYTGPRAPESSSTVSRRRNGIVNEPNFLRRTPTYTGPRAPESSSTVSRRTAHANQS
ncbi:uncharacterized protein MELLADRAFT_93937 [Melampsora larici-populina 98AG31]|uniref:Secreted protein n=1 Tax=Melampsora larici-populina (strain 98AG31 / pathotype 3-4-7) TaxID=747676 RepID=F4S5U0_MELLP|nr:uncharacterized protein MELLADRAFT_93937 [Melampsora larici-populina 98AG31]EGG00005.1 secreted protein [Melampsora larici-populina 98AG31]